MCYQYMTGGQEYSCFSVSSAMSIHCTHTHIFSYCYTYCKQMYHNHHHIDQSTAMATATKWTPKLCHPMVILKITATVYGCTLRVVESNHQMRNLNSTLSLPVHTFLTLGLTRCTLLILWKRRTHHAPGSPRELWTPTYTEKEKYSIVRFVEQDMRPVNFVKGEK